MSNDSCMLNVIQNIDTFTTLKNLRCWWAFKLIISPHNNNKINQFLIEIKQELYTCVQRVLKKNIYIHFLYEEKGVLKKKQIRKNA